jgi:hypothetical protein
MAGRQNSKPSGSFQMNDYIDVAERIRIFHKEFPDGTLQQVNLQFIEFGGEARVVYTAAAFRHPDDDRPGIGTAWETVPGKTPYTNGSEVQNAETSAWGRAIVALGITDTNHIASREEIEVRNAERQAVAGDPDFEAKNAVKTQIKALLPDSGPGEIVAMVSAATGKPPEAWTLADLEKFRDGLPQRETPGEPGQGT